MDTEDNQIVAREEGQKRWAKWETGIKKYHLLVKK